MIAALSLAVLLHTAAGAAEKPRLVVMELTPGSGVDAAAAAPLTDAIASEAVARGFFEVLSTRDVQTLLGLERQRQLLGCSEEAAQSCLAELSGALGARFVLSGSLARLGSTWQLSLTTLDSQRAQPIGRSTRLAKSLDELRVGLPWAVAEATATPMPPPPSRVVPVTLLGVGGAGAMFGLVWGAVHLAQERELAARLDAAKSTPGLLAPAASYEEQARFLTTQKWVAAGSLAGGLALVVLGAVLMPSDSTSGGARAALVPTGTGAALVGVFP